MAMTTCTECKKPVSTEAKTCPHCGYTPKHQPDPMKGLAKLFLVCMVGLSMLVMCSSEDEKTTAKNPKTDPASQRRLQEEVGALLYIKSNMKNPDSFNLVSFIRTPGNTLCITYRGTNSFNAIVTQRHTINNATNSNSDSDWAAHCEGRGGQDVSNAKYALP
jgi:hypothetical protein